MAGEATITNEYLPEFNIATKIYAKLGIGEVTGDTVIEADADLMLSWFESGKPVAPVEPDEPEESNGTPRF